MQPKLALDSYGPGSGSGRSSREPAEGAAGGARLNLLLSCAGWQDQGWAEVLPRLLEPMGVASTRVQSAREAEVFLRSSRVHIAVVDLGLPLERTAASGRAEEAGARVLELLSRLESPPPTVVVRPPRMQREMSRDMNAALRCGAFAVVDRTAADVELMLGVMQRCLSRFYAGRWPGCGGGGAGGGGGGMRCA
ncbi:MAG: hypothetical protein LW650_13955 [Planctomycetaceae bacterium]|nr:hypothetical protein [Phycisphaerales bacterium]MCE2654503.1 hypothetical protein [Planctomycetaceae bacterium]